MVKYSGAGVHWMPRLSIWGIVATPKNQQVYERFIVHGLDGQSLHRGSKSNGSEGRSDDCRHIYTRMPKKIKRKIAEGFQIVNPGALSTRTKELTRHLRIRLRDAWPTTAQPAHVITKSNLLKATFIHIGESVQSIWCPVRSRSTFLSYLLLPYLGIRSYLTMRWAKAPFHIANCANK